MIRCSATSSRIVSSNAGLRVSECLFQTLEPATNPKSDAAVYDGGAYVNRSRLVFTLCGVLLGALGCILSRSYQFAGGFKAAVIATILFAFDPTFLAHSSIVKNDGG